MKSAWVRAVAILLVAMLVLTGLGAVLSSAMAADWKRPSHALAKVGQQAEYRAGGYYEGCYDCRGFSARTYSSGDGYASGLDSRGRLVTVARGSDRVTVRRHASPTAKATGARTIKAPKGWTVGGFHLGSDGYWYLALGRENPKEKKNRAVVQVRRYDQSLRLRGTVEVKGGVAAAPGGLGGISVPFRSGTVAMVVHQGRLWLHLARQEFKHTDGLNHQSAMVMRLDFSTGKAEYVMRNASHSFNQFIVSDGQRLVTVDHGDAYPRGLEVQELHWNDEDPDHSYWDSRSMVPFKFRGKVGANYTGATLNAVTLGSSRVLTAGIAVPHSKAVKGVTGSSRKLWPNVHLTSSDPRTGRSTFRWITTYHPKKTTARVGHLRLTALGKDRFALLYDVTKRGSTKGTTHYLLIDEQGRTLAHRTFSGAFRALSAPVLQGKRLVWVNEFSKDRHGFDRVTHLSALDVSNPQKPVLLKRG